VRVLSSESVPQILTTDVATDRLQRKKLKEALTSGELSSATQSRVNAWATRAAEHSTPSPSPWTEHRYVITVLEVTLSLSPSAVPSPPCAVWRSGGVMLSEAVVIRRQADRWDEPHAVETKTESACRHRPAPAPDSPSLCSQIPNSLCDCHLLTPLHSTALGRSAFNA
jgi:hypothetical protein